MAVVEILGRVRVNPLIWLYTTALIILAFIYAWCKLCYLDP